MAADNAGLLTARSVALTNNRFCFVAVRRAANIAVTIDACCVEKRLALCFDAAHLV